MRSRVAKIVLEVAAAVALVFLLSSCGAEPYCPTCGTTVNGAYGVLNVIPVPEHNPTGEPGGPFNSFDISFFDPNYQMDYVSDRIGLDVVVVDAKNNYAVNTIGGLNEVADNGNNGSPCWGPQQVTIGGDITAVPTSAIPSIITGAGSLRDPATSNVLTRFGCRNAPYFGSFGTYFPGFGANGFFGGFPGAQCCAARANGVNPLSGPDGEQVTPDGTTLFSGSGSSTVVAFDLTTTPPVVLAEFPTGSSPDFDGPVGVAPCIETWNGGAGSDPTCGDDRSDELSYGTVNGHDILAVTNGDPGLPLVTFIDVTDIVNRTNTPPFTLAGGYGPAGGGFGHCLPLSYPAYNVVGTTADNYFPGANPPACIIGQIYYDGVATEESDVPVDDALEASGTPCPDPSEAVPSGVSGRFTPGSGPLAGSNVVIPCHHAPIVDYNTGAFITSNTNVTAPGPNQFGEIAPAGLGGSMFNPFHSTFYVFNSNCTVSNLSTQASTAVGCVDEVDPRIGNPNGPVVIAVIPILNCMPTSGAQGPGHDMLIGCAGHDGTQFPPLEVIIDGTTNQIVANITETGGVDEVWYNPGDNRYYTAGRDMPNGPVLGVIDAGTRLWLVNVTTGSNSHSVTVNQFTNQIFVPMQAGTLCTTQSANGCIAVYGRQ